MTYFDTNGRIWQQAWNILNWSEINTTVTDFKMQKYVGMHQKFFAISIYQ